MMFTNVDEAQQGAEEATRNAEVAYVQIIERNSGDPQTTKDYVEEYFEDIPVLAKVAECESHFRQYDDNGQLFRGDVDPDDLGVMQINRRYHGEEASNLGIDISTLEGNLEYSRHLYSKDGLAPWSASRGCWGSNHHLAMKN